MREQSRGKDTTIGHFEIAGIISKQPLPTYPNGFPKSIISRFEEATGRRVICNMPYSGTDVIRDFGDEHVKSGDLIVYTSADSVFQIAAHEDIVPLEDLYEYCRMARKILTGEHGVGRVIARPFTTDENGNYKRTANRHDFSLVPPKKTALAAIKEIDERLGLHDFRFVEGITHTNLIFDVTVPFEIKDTDREIEDKIAKKVSEMDPNYFTVLTIDRE